MAAGTRGEVGTDVGWRPWRVAMQESLYGPAGFYRREEPDRHFRTSAQLPAFGAAIRRLAGYVDSALGLPDPFDLVDLGAGSGALLGALPDVPARWRLTGVEVRPDPGGPWRWTDRLPRVRGLLLANEWLDNIALDVVREGRLVEVAVDGTERIGPPAPAADLAWCRRWWPEGPAEVGLPRDEAWAAATAQVDRGLAVAVDYGHTVAERRPTLTGYRDGRQVPPRPDGSCDLTAHVAVDACADATGSRVTTQRDALRRLGLHGALPDPVTAAGLVRASDEGELLDAAGLGGFSWLVKAVGITDPLTVPA